MRESLISMRHSLFPLGMFVLWLGSYIVYPLWYLPQENLRGTVFGLLLIFFVANFFLIDRFIYSLKLDNGKRCYPPIKGEKIIWWSGIIYFLLQIYPITLPVISRNDEEHYLASSLVYYLKLSLFWERWVRIPWSWCAWFLLFLLIFIVRKKTWLIFLTKRKFLIFYFLLLTTIIYYIIFIRYISLNSFFYLFHHPPLYRFFNIMAYSLFGAREFGPRLVQAVFGFLSAIYLYKLVTLYRSREIALFSFIFWLFMPACLFFGNLALLENAISFFIISSFYYLLKYYRDKSKRDLFLGLFIISIGAICHNVVIVALIVYYLYLLPSVVSKKISIFRDKALLILPAWATLATILPYLILTTFVYAPVDYPFSPGELFSKGAYLAQLKLTLSGLGAIHIFFLIIGIIIIVRRRDDLSLFTFIWLVNYFLLQIIYFSAPTGVFRLLVPYFPVLAIWMAEGVGVAVKRKEIFKGLVVPFLAYAVLTSTIWIVPPLSQRLVLYHNIHSRYLPYPEAIMYLKENLSPDKRCLSPGHSSPEKFYCLKFGLSPSQIDHAWWWADGIERQTGDNLYEYAKSHKIKFCLFPSGDWPESFLNFGLRDRLVRGEDKRFILERVFLSGQNKLYLFEVR